MIGKLTLGRIAQREVSGKSLWLLPPDKLSHCWLACSSHNCPEWNLLGWHLAKYKGSLCLQSTVQSSHLGHCSTASSPDKLPCTEGAGGHWHKGSQCQATCLQNISFLWAFWHKTCNEKTLRFQHHSSAKTYTALPVELHYKAASCETLPTVKKVTQD